jgi:hypothetical protein
MRFNIGQPALAGIKNFIAVYGSHLIQLHQSNDMKQHARDRSHTCFANALSKQG